MDRRVFLQGLVGAACLSGAGGLGAARASEGPHWGYEGANGPAAWGDLDPAYGACATGREQSPVDLTRAVGAALADPLPEWRPVPLRVFHSDHAIQVNALGGGRLTLDGARYELLHYHFHHPSEHQIDGAVYPMECHFVHRGAGGALAVIGVMIAEGEAHPAIEAIWRLMPERAGEETADPDARLDPTALLPDDRVSFRYAGSLTVPPCSEVVQWAVFRRPITASAAQIERFTTLFPHNARPVQPLNRRTLLLDVF
jgi:carbonic anhydrase